MSDRNPYSTRPCPCCGADSSHHVVGRCHRAILGEKHKSVPSTQVVCSQCGIRGPMIPEAFDADGGGARLAWNVAIEVGELRRANVAKLAEALGS